MRKNTVLMGGGVAAVGIGLILLGNVTGETPTWRSTDVACLPGGHTGAARHVHPELTISVDGTEERIPANVGVSNGCMAEVHTHDSSGRLHVETADADTVITLRDFFAVWDKELRRPGHDTDVIVNGSPHDISEPLELTENQRIAVAYTSSAATSSATMTQ